MRPDHAAAPRRARADGRETAWTAHGTNDRLVTELAPRVAALVDLLAAACVGLLPFPEVAPGLVRLAEAVQHQAELAAAERRAAA